MNRAHDHLQGEEHKAAPVALVLCNSSARGMDLLGAIKDTPFAGRSAHSFDELQAKITNCSVLVMELVLDDLDGIEVIRYLGQRVNQPELVFLSDLEPRIVTATRRLAAAKGLHVRAALSNSATDDEIVSVLNQPSHDGSQAHPSPIVLTDQQHLRRGLARDEFVVHFQPKVDVQTLGLASVEALVRWKHPDYGMLGPNSFIRLAEHSGLIAPLTEVVVEKSFKHASRWRESGIPLKVAVNISGASLADLSLPDKLATTAAKFELSPDNIVVEITESWVAQNEIDALDILTRLRLKDFNLSIDDFGTGYSTMLKLKQIPFSELKLDQSIIRGAANDTDSRTIVETSIELGHRLGLHLVAEGVERQADWDLITDLGCNEGQGYFIARPMTAADLPDWLSRWNLSLGV